MYLLHKGYAVYVRDYCKRLVSRYWIWSQLCILYQDINTQYIQSEASYSGRHSATGLCLPSTYTRLTHLLIPDFGCFGLTIQHGQTHRSHPQKPSALTTQWLWFAILMLNVEVQLVKIHHLATSADSALSTSQSIW